jgi:hypothetical protein
LARQYLALPRARQEDDVTFGEDVGDDAPTLESLAAKMTG